MRMRAWAGPRAALLLAGVCGIAFWTVLRAVPLSTPGFVVASPEPYLGAPGAPRNALNLYEAMIEGAPEFDLVGRVEDRQVRMGDLERQSHGAFSRIAVQIFEARDRGYRWLIERAALQELASAEKLDLRAYLQREFLALPTSTEGDLERERAAEGFESLPASEHARAARSRWRWRAWEARRSALIRSGLPQVEQAQVRLDMTRRESGNPRTVIAIVQGREVTRAQLRALAGYPGEEARREYYEIAKRQFEELADRVLWQREAARAGMTVPELESRERADLPPVTDAEARQLIRSVPPDAQAPEIYERARDQLRRQRWIDRRQALERRMRETARVEFFLLEPNETRIPVEVPAPLSHGRADSEDHFVAFHGLLCEPCAEGAELIRSIAERYSARLRLQAGDLFPAGGSAGYGAALALHCANAQGKWWQLFQALSRSREDVSAREILEKAGQVGIELREFAACRDRDRFLPDVFENLEVGRRLGFEPGWPALFVNGVRIVNLSDVREVRTQVEKALGLPETERGR